MQEILARCLLGPVDGALTQRVNAVGERVALARGRVTPGKYDGLQASVQLWQGHLHHARCL